MNYCATRGSLLLLFYPQLLVIKNITSRQTVGITRGLFSRVLGADNPSFRPVMGKRGESGVATGAGSSPNELTTEAASPSVTPSRWARAARERAGASPRVRRAANSAGKRT